MTQRLLVMMFLGISVAFASPAEAQRSGFIIGFGLGAGVVSANPSSVRATNTGFSGNFHIGGVVSGVEVFYVSKVTLEDAGTAGDYLASGVSGLGVAYPINDQVAINGGIGVYQRNLISAVGGAVSIDSGLGLEAGVRYLLGDGRWGIDLDVLYGKPGDLTLYGAQLTFSVLSH